MLFLLPYVLSCVLFSMHGTEAASPTPTDLSSPADLAQCLENCLVTLNLDCPPKNSTNDALACLCANTTSIKALSSMYDCVDIKCRSSSLPNLILENPLLLCPQEPKTAGALVYSGNGSSVTNIATATIDATVTDDAGRTLQIHAPVYSAYGAAAVGTTSKSGGRSSNPATSGRNVGASITSGSPTDTTNISATDANNTGGAKATSSAVVWKRAGLARVAVAICLLAVVLA